MRGTWDDVNRRLTSTLLALDLGDVLTIGDAPPTPAKKGLFGRARAASSAGPRRYAMVTATRNELVAEVVGSTSFGGDWPMTPEQEAYLERTGWQRPWSDELLTWIRDAPLQRAPNIAIAIVRALQELGCEVEQLEVSLSREDPDA
ncbi:TY-Chap domain-containing protein [Nocardioides acrostichi]|uniref:TY-Chap N-terminal domain-containing protein n=1 Tax=Nocardioides acrostichi TaxID=2784339 RepID=A0A930V3R6_9ACTN|nr:hypothetical protein [Nocardioides acrostichi]MBF4163170.1 hypothetical protein [Nocardioides acrostichi]